jgi:intein/homing endonuclease
MNILTISEALSQARVWHKIQDNFVCTKRARIKIPEVNDKVAYLAGVIAGDGNVNTCKRKKGGYHYRVNIVGHREDLENLATMFNDLFDYKPCVLRDKRKADCHLINIYSAAIYFYFVKLGFPTGKKKNIRVPRKIADNPTLFKSYMIGLIDTDGSIGGNRVQLKQRDERFLHELVFLLKRHLSIESNPPKVNYTKGKPFYYIRFPIDGLDDLSLFKLCGCCSTD